MQVAQGLCRKVKIPETQELVKDGRVGGAVVAELLEDEIIELISASR